MKPIKLTLTGFIGIKSGMALDTFTLDLTEYDDAQLVAIVAPNGRGKTTILDSLTPFRLMPSKIKNANYSPSAFSFFDHLVPGKSSKDLVWEHQGQTYRTLMEWNITNKTQSTNAYLQVKDGDDWKPVTLPSGMSSDGKASTYDQCVEGILGSPRLYFTAAFSAQGRSQLSSYAQGDIKGLMSEVLGLAQIKDLGDKAAEVCKGLKRKLEGCREDQAKMGDIKGLANELVQEISDKGEELEGVHLPAIAKHKAAADQERAAIIEINRDQQDHEQNRVKREALQQQVTEEKTRHESAVDTIRQDQTAAGNQHLETTTRLDNEANKLADAIRRATAKKGDAETVLGQREQIEQAQKALPELRETLKQAEAAVEAARVLVNDAKHATTQLAQADRHIVTLVEVGKRAAANEQDLVDRCALTKEVPCQGTDMQGQCKLLADAIAAEGKLPAVRADLAAKREEHAKAKQERESLAVEAAKLADLEHDLSNKVAAKNLADESLRMNEQLAAKADQLVTAERDLEEAVGDIQAYNEQLDDIRGQKAAAEQQHEKRLADLTVRRAQEDSAHESTIRRLQTELGRIPVPDDESILRTAEQRLTDAEKAEQDARDAADRARSAIATAEGHLEALKDRIAKGEHLAGEIAHLEEEIAHWSSLQKALGRDGILALSIDDAGPTLASLTNDLLLSCYGPRFSVRIDTQETVKSTGNQRETFDITVFDAESDTQKSVSDMSGGERIWINEALTRAIALYQAQQSGQSFHTLFSDESDGALDPEKKGQFVQMKRRVLELGGYEREFFISHSPEVCAMADAEIRLEGDGQEQRVAA